MRRLLTYTTAMLVALAGTVAVAQKATNPGELEAAMKRVSAQTQALAKASSPKRMPTPRPRWRLSRLP